MLIITSASVLLASYMPLGPMPSRPHALALRAQSPVASADVTAQYSRAEFWTDEKATLLDVLNVMGRWQSSSQWSERTEFVSEDAFNYREETILQGLTEKRYRMAQKLNQVERAAFFINIPKMPFTDAKLAASVGKTVEDFNAMEPPSISHCNVVYDALAQSKSGLIPPDVVDSRRNGFITPDGGLDEGAFAVGLYKARGIVIASWFLFGKGQILGFVIGFKVFVYDGLNLANKIQIPYLDYLVLAACIGAAVFAAGAQANDTAEAMAALSAYENQAKEQARVTQQQAAAGGASA